METSKAKLKPLTIIISIALLVFSALTWFNIVRSSIYTDVLDALARPGVSEKFNLATAAISDKFNDLAYKRIDLSRKDAVLTYRVTGEITSTQVVKGEDGWLFYFPNGDGDPLDIYEGKTSLDKEELGAIVDSVKETNDYLAQKGIGFSLMIAPNKETIYFEHVPVEYIKADYTQTDQIAEALNKTNINFVYLKDALLKEKDNGYPLYYQTDTHWNKLGGYIGAKEILKFLDQGLNDIGNLTISEESRSGGDLVNMVGIGKYIDYEKEYVIEGMPVIDVRVDDDLVHLTNDSAVNNGKVFVVGDSFRKGILPGLLSQYSDVYVVHRDNYVKGMLGEIEPDYVIAVYVERYAPKIVSLASILVGE